MSDNDALLDRLAKQRRKGESLRAFASRLRFPVMTVHQWLESRPTLRRASADCLKRRLSALERAA